MILKFLMTFLVAQPSFATICLRAPQVSPADFQEWTKNNPQCENSEEILFRQMQTDPDQDLEVLSSRLRKADGQRKKQIEVFRDFFERKKKQAWSQRTVDVVVEVLKRWSEEAGHPKEMRTMIDQLEQPSDAIAGSFRLADWSDAVVYRNGSPQKGIAGSGQNHWVIFSTLYRPVILWGTANQALDRLRGEKRPWLTGTCEKPALNFNTSSEEDYLFLYPGGCVASRPSLVLPLNKNQPTITTALQPKKEFYQSPVFWAVTAVTAIVISSALKNKTVSIRSAFR